ncbi:GATOR complex protein NPRL3-like isoform X2 [Branchiostoma floridae]|uniref:GATOR complex protein NPRL3 n=1 Tax=Branchiostoma floridae TaxID=7739 RepID=A0A9J7M7D1_BRAFL|nr:GATOR complex protein NPRL3-like isoform X2 [Branchiostoma floridae]
MADCSPISIILVSSGSLRGDRLLFRYPYQELPCKPAISPAVATNPYVLREADCSGSTSNQGLTGYTDKILATLMATKTELAGEKFELKVDNLRFVGHPTLLHQISSFTDLSKSEGPSPRREPSPIILFNIVFVIQANVSPSLNQYYHDLSKRLALAIRHEEWRCGYLNKQAQIMRDVHDEVSAMPEDSAPASPFQHMIPRCDLARELRDVYTGLCDAGIVNIRINSWILVSFCLPHKVHNNNVDATKIEPEAVERCISAIRPYHAMLLLVDRDGLLEELPQDCSPALTRLIRIATPLKSLQCLSQDSDLALSQIFQLVSHLVYWGKATIIYPLAESNVYTLSPNAKTSVNSLLCEKFLEQFPGVCLPAIMADFSLPLPLGEHRNPLGLPQQQAQLVQMVVWMLQHRLLVQLHTYIYLMSMDPETAGTGAAKSQASPLLLVPDDAARNRTISGGSEAISVGSPDGGELELSSSVETYSTYSTEMGSDGMLITKDARLQRKLTESLLSDLTEGERLSVLKVPAASNPEDLRLFARLVWYFRGQHHLEEIMYYENLRRSQLLTLLDKFREVLITCQHEDAAAAVFHTKQY